MSVASNKMFSESPSPNKKPPSEESFLFGYCLKEWYQFSKMVSLMPAPRCRYTRDSVKII